MLAECCNVSPMQSMKSRSNTGTACDCVNHRKKMKITKSTLIERMEYLFNVTGEHYNLTCQCSGNGKGYSVMDDMGRHVMTYGHVSASELDACITAYVKGYLRNDIK
jgi:hypothetical protein